MSRIITATHLEAVNGQGSVGPMQVGNSLWVSMCVCVCVCEQVLVSCRGEYSDSERPKQCGWLSYFQFTVETVLQVFAKSAQEIGAEIRR